MNSYPEEVWIVETKGREDLDDPAKWERLQQWCVDATDLYQPHRFRPLFVREDDWDDYPRAQTFEDFTRTFT